MITNAILMLLVIFCGFRAFQLVRQKSLTCIFWATNAFYIFIILSVMNVDAFTDTFPGYPYITISSKIRSEIAYLLCICLFCYFAGESLVFQLLPNQKGVISAPTSNDKNFARTLLFAFLGFLVPATLFGAGTSYEDFVSGASIGWGVTFFYLASCGAVYLLITPVQMYVKLLLALWLIGTGLAFSILTTVRFLLLVPILSLLISLLLIIPTATLRTTKNFLIAGFLLFTAMVLFQVVTFFRLGTLEIPESFLGVTFLITATRELETPNLIEAENILYRLLSGFFFYPADKLGFSPSPMKDAGHYISLDMIGPWAAAWAHFPATWFLDLLMTSPEYFGIQAFGLGLSVALLVSICNAAGVYGFAFLPLLGVAQILIVRGAIFNATQSISAIICFLIFIILFTKILFASFHFNK